MPLDEATKKEVVDLVVEAVNGSNKALKDELPGWINRVSEKKAAEAVEAFKATLPKPEVVVTAAKPNDANHDSSKTELAQLKADQRKLEDELKKRDQIASDAVKRSVIQSAVSQVPWFDANDAVKELEPLVVKKDDGYFIPYIHKITEDVKEERLKPLADAVKELAEKKPYLVKAVVKGGSGATGNNAKSSGAADNLFSLNYEQIYGNPANVSALLKTEEGRAHLDKAKQDRHNKK